ncbi:hypothetical protein [Lysobacter silvisoli]|uniref:DUF4124 domain-containing protein n=1 Tax=Lysobacter silvisoli TaxID=2293254 RepID=A0A371K5T3_9GAMM|nr:hypothetical protein [Lysobacter silvisoli]RDZ29238.1 hypothetical protein DX914_09160 [Lysobacter silvisoli]
MSKHTLLSIGLWLALASGSAWAATGTVVQYPNGTWGCVDQHGNPIPAGANGRWEGKPVVGTPCSPARFVVADGIEPPAGATGRPVRAQADADIRAAATGQTAQAQPQAGAERMGARAQEYAGASFDAKGVSGPIAEPAAKSISEKGLNDAVKSHRGR